MIWQTIRGVSFQISPEDLSIVSGARWSLDPKGYVRTTEYRPRLLHRILIPEVPVGFCVDHINWDKLDNRRENLRVISFRENNLNHKNLFAGVSFHKASGKWRAYAYYYKKQISLGLFNTYQEALHARQQYSPRT